MAGPPWAAAPPAAAPPPPPPAAGGRRLGGVTLAFFSTAAASAMGVCVKLAGEAGVPTFQVVATRSAVVLVLAAALLARGRTNPWASARRGLLAVRGLVGFASISCFYAAVTQLPIADGTVLGMLQPIMVAPLAALTLGERPPRATLAAVAACFAGVVLVAQPAALFGRAAAPLPAAGVAAGLAAPLLTSVAKLMIRSLGRTEPVASIIFAMAFASTLGGVAACAVLPGQAFVAPATAAAVAFPLAAGLCACAVQLLVTVALRRVGAAEASAATFSAVVWGLAADAAIWRRVPNALGLLGAAIVCGGSLFVLAAGHGAGGGDGAAGDRGGGGGEYQLVPTQRGAAEAAEAAEAGGGK